MDLTLKHINRRAEVQRKLDALLKRESIQDLTDTETEELVELQTEYFRCNHINTYRFRLGWCLSYESELNSRHNLAQALSVNDRIVTLMTFRRSFDILCKEPLETLRNNAALEFLSSKTVNDKIADLRADCPEPKTSESGMEEIEGVLDCSEKTSDQETKADNPTRKLDSGYVIVHRYGKSGGRDDKERDEFAKKLAEPKDLAGPMLVDDVDEICSALYDESPWLSEPIRHIWSEARANAAQGNPFGFDPVLMYGGPGLGKSYMSTALARLSGCPTVQLNGGNMSAAFDVSGSEKLWRSAGPGVCVRAIHDHGIANPLIIFDELDKTPRGSSGGDPQLALLPLLQSDTAERYRCPYVQGTVDLSFVNWLACANDVSAMPRPLLDRFAVFEVKSPSGELLLHFLERKFDGLDMPRGKMIEMKRAIEKGTLSLRGALKLESRLRAYDARPLLN